MVGSGEEVGGFGLFQAVAPLGQEFHIPGQGGGVAGDINQPLGIHLDDGLDDLGGDPLPGRVHADHVGADALLS